MKNTAASQTSKKTDWAAEARKYKPQLNQLTDSERQQLLTEAEADINGAKTAPLHVRRR